MDKPEDEISPDSAEKAYAAAAETAAVKPADVEQADDAAPAPLPFPAKAKRAPVSKTIAPAPSEVAADPAPVALPAELEADLATPKLKRAAAPKPAKAVKPKRAKPVVSPSKKAASRKAAPVRKAAVTKPAIKPVVKATKPVAPTKLSRPAIKPALALSKTKTIKTITQLKDKIMPTKKPTDYTKEIKTVLADAQAKAKLALAKGSAVLSEASTFTKGNVDAVVESGKILATGIQGLGKEYVAEGKSAYETLTADVKEFTKVKSPTEFVSLQTKVMRRNVDHAFSLGSKNSEAMFKLMSDVVAPLSARTSLVVAKLKKAA